MKNRLLLVAALLGYVLNAVSQEEIKDISLEDIFQNRIFSSKRISDIKPMNDGELYCLLINDSLNIYDYKKGNYKGTIVTATQLIQKYGDTPISMRRYQLSYDENKIIFATETEKIYRHSSKSNYYIYDLNSQNLFPLSNNGKQRLAAFSPDATKVAFVRDNNLFISDLILKTEEQITKDGLYNKIINGATDWVYEEEFGFTKAFFWSPDSKNIAFYRFDETNVKEFQMTIWGELYPEYHKFKYPKAGEDNSDVQIYLYNLENKESKLVNIGKNTYSYIPRIKWTNDANILAIQSLNRHQNELTITLADATSGNTEIIYQESNKYYIRISDNLTFLNNNEHFIITSEQDGFNHIYLFDILGNLEQQITKGNWDVDKLYGINEKKGLIYFSSSESSPINRELYTIRLDGTEKKKISPNPGTNIASFSKNHKYYINTFSDANTPPIITVNNSNGSILRTVIDNSELVKSTKDYNFTKKEFFEFTTTENIQLNGWMIKPHDFDSTKKYPVLMFVYGGPGSQRVLNSWGRRLPWFQMLSSKGLIIVCVDNRGTGARGEEFKKITYQQLGKYETLDQIETAKHLGALGYVDKNRIGIWGWSYGGYVTASCLTKGSEYFSMGIAVAPVTNWRYYDNIYTERYMRTPQENPSGYDENSPIFHAEKLKGNLLLIHGTGDDNVHVQHTIDFSSALVKANKQFEMQLYPNSNHGIYTGQNTTLHLYTRMTDFIMQNLVNNLGD